MYTDRRVGSTPGIQGPKSRLALSLFFFAILLPVTAEVLAIAIRNGVFGYTLDDPYIHLALARRIQDGLYGINPGEFSAPSSSIIWPLLLAAVPSATPGWVLLPLLLNFASVLVIGGAFVGVLRTDESATGRGMLSLGIAIAIALNLAGLVMTGMEHTLQVALTVLGIWGLVEFEQTGHFPLVAVAAFILAPLVRYENLAITIPACAYLVLVGRWRTAMLIVLATGACVAAFSAILVAHGLSALPTSVLAKAQVVSTGLVPHENSGISALPTLVLARAMAAAARMGMLGTETANLKWNLMETQAWTLLLLTVPIVVRFVRPRSPADRRLAGLAMTSVALHMVAGRFNWYSRYEIYIFSAVVIVLIALYRGELSRQLFARTASGRASWARPLVLLALSAIVFHRYAGILQTIPLASNDIYLQQMQMARFASGYWKRAVAVNDLGAVALLSNSYILDFGGLASQEAMHAWTTEPFDPLWMDKLAKRHEVGLAMVYSFPAPPPNWTMVARLHLNVQRITPAYSTVGFYATIPALVPEIHDKLRQFAGTLPKGSSLEIL